MDRVHQAGDNQVEPVAALEEYPALARAHEGETWFDAGAWSEDLADSYLGLGRVGDAVRAIGDATRSGHAEGAEVLCELAGKVMRSGCEPPGQALVAAGNMQRPAATQPTVAGECGPAPGRQRLLIGLAEAYIVAAFTKPGLPMRHTR